MVFKCWFTYNDSWKYIIVYRRFFKLKWEEYGIILCIVAILLLIGFYFGEQTTGHFEMYDYHDAKGFYNFNTNYYCVYTDHRWVSDVVTTDVHESCHALIELDTNIFVRGV